MDTIIEEIDKSHFKIKESRREITDLMDSMIKDIDTNLDKINTAMQDVGEEDIFDVQLKFLMSANALSKKIDDTRPLQKVIKLNQGAYAHISKIGKSIGKVYNSSLEQISYDVCFDKNLLNKIIVKHLYRNGKFDCAELLSREAEIHTETTEHQMFGELNKILIDLKHRDFKSVTKWIEQNSEELNKIESTLFFNLYKIQFLGLLMKKNAMECIFFAKQNFNQFKNNPVQYAEIERLMASLIYMNTLESSPYSDLTSEGHWSTFIHSLIRDYSKIKGLSKESELYQTIKAGTLALPDLIKVSNVKKGVGSWLDTRELPLEIEVGKEFKYHSIFICPVSKEVSTRDNPPMMLTCGHVLAKNSLQKLKRSLTQTKVKCPTCPLETQVTDAKTINL